jgi:hypothetical protein
VHRTPQKTKRKENAAVREQLDEGAAVVCKDEAERTLLKNQSDKTNKSWRVRRPLDGHIGYRTWRHSRATTTKNKRRRNKASNQDIADAYASQALAEAAEPVRETNRGDDTALPAELVRDGALSFERVREATPSSSGMESVRESAPAESTRESVSERAEMRPDMPEFLPDREPAEPALRTAVCEPAEPVRDTSGVVVKPDRGQLSNESAATDEFGVLTPEVTGVIMEIGLNEGERGSYFG